jgi:hypothetical protein
MAARHGGVVGHNRDGGGALLWPEVGDGEGGPGPWLGLARAAGLDAKVGRGGGGGFYWVCFGKGKA